MNGWIIWGSWQACTRRSDWPGGWMLKSLGSVSRCVWERQRWLISRFAECRLRSRLVQTQPTLPDQVHKPTARPTMRWVFPCFEDMELLLVQTAATSLVLVSRLQPVHRLILTLFGPLYEKISLPSA
ncbi:MAG TPA: hypothetical protein VGF67_18275 [Ktedonobacteraceae bacterium]